MEWTTVIHKDPPETLAPIPRNTRKIVLVNGPIFFFIGRRENWFLPGVRGSSLPSWRFSTLDIAFGKGKEKLVTEEFYRLDANNDRLFPSFIVSLCTLRPRLIIVCNVDYYVNWHALRKTYASPLYWIGNASYLKLKIKLLECIDKSYEISSNFLYFLPFINIGILCRNDINGRGNLMKFIFSKIVIY